uniref:Uncharacterized protein n=1 Tax=Candidatus Kentrum sp. MB TaxID=2138164 RepID=A0A451BH06_9GAMM|nr:MAG: hypothetical protein BECKMB1821G_GA0114241_11452 [Candidatus Kentron sp. MB]VFK35902.1 MAG: hypothetical protein BECKMB1821I_GA0114274_11592 [Candidatus Kentron sp. MB]VFK77547.1 MAG: hypothetical protein BECKMB1821H_GA0114242_11602 [Candidatus Kentron sp. MB]
MLVKISKMLRLPIARYFENLIETLIPLGELSGILPGYCGQFFPISVRLSQVIINLSDSIDNLSRNPSKLPHGPGKISPNRAKIPVLSAVCPAISESSSVIP